MGYIAVVDYGVGNLHSIVNAMKYLGLETRITGDARELERADGVSLPGVGAVPDAADRLRETGLDAAVIQQTAKKPVLGICLGMQLLFEQGDEVRPSKGLALIPGEVTRIKTDCKLPHIGWNTLHFLQENPLFRNVDEGSSVYFVHSFAAVPAQGSDLVAQTEYGVPVTAAVARGNVYGCQFHPEKSGEVGLQILRNFGALSR